MSSDYLDEEEKIADERDHEDLMAGAILNCTLEDLPELQPVVGVAPASTVRETLQEMINRRVGCVLVLEDDRVVGVFSERDALCKVALGEINVDNTTVADVMTPNPETLSADSELVYALHKMVVGGYRHVPMLNDNGKPVNVVSMRDIVGYIVSLYPTEVLNLPDSDQPISGNREGA